MVDLALMIEGQDGVNWPRWQRLAAAAEGLGYAGLYRSDHFTNPEGPHTDALELWASLTWLASNTARIEFGPMVSPVSFRNPVITAWTSAAVDDLSGGRLHLGMGAGWQEREHNSFGFDLLDIDQRFVRFEEGLNVVRQLLTSDEPTTFNGSFYHLDDAVLLPRPQRPGGPPIVIGGNGPKRTLPLAAKYADEWNAVYLSAAEFAQRSALLDQLLDAQNRPRTAVRRTLMTRIIFGRDDAEAAQIAGDAEAARAKGAIVGTANQVVEELGKRAEAGAQRVMAQWLELDDIDRIEAMAASVLPQL
ncbi:MAG: TIGR03560 family F420-dependent LLM class oxidoreductase [Thermomicrobiales bacterium]